MKERAEEAKMLLRLARRDLKTYELLKINGIDFVEPAKFHAQQCVEKSLKAVLSAKKIRFNRTHDLTELVDSLTVAGFPPPFESSDLGKLNPYAVLFRYDDRDISVIEYKETSKYVEGVYKWAKKVVKETEDSFS